MGHQDLQRRFLRLIDEFAILLYESEVFHEIRLARKSRRSKDEEALCGTLTSARYKLAGLRRSVAEMTDETVVAFVGMSNAGKSTLLNLLLGHELSPSGNLPTTSVPTEYRYGKSCSAALYYADRIEPTRFAIESISHIPAFLQKHATETGNLGTHARPEKAVIYVPIELLKNGLAVADTPGFGEAPDKHGRQVHTEATLRYLRSESTHVILLADLRTGASGVNADKFGHLYDVCDEVLLTRGEEVDWSSEEQRQMVQEIVGSVRAHLVKKKNQVPIVEVISSRSGMESLKNTPQDIHSAHEKAGINHLVKRIRAMENIPARLEVVSHQLPVLTRELRTWFQRARDASDTPLSDWWRGDSFSRWAALRSKLPCFSPMTKLLTPPGPKWQARSHLHVQ
jgi:GTP-binding protein EngB required for normal cell division